jgi:hypothetical protein
LDNLQAVLPLAQQCEQEGWPELEITGHIMVQDIEEMGDDENETGVRR